MQSVPFDLNKHENISFFDRETMVKGQKTQTVLTDLCIYVSQDCTGKLPKLQKGLFRFEITSKQFCCNLQNYPNL